MDGTSYTVNTDAYLQTQQPINQFLFTSFKIRDAVISKKLIELFVHSTVNMMVGCTLLILSINDFNLPLPCFHRKNLSTVYLHHKYGLHSDSFNISSSLSQFFHKYNAIRRCKFTTDRSPPFLLKCLFLELNMLFFKTTSAKSKIVS